MYDDCAMQPKLHLDAAFVTPAEAGCVVTLTTTATKQS